MPLYLYLSANALPALFPFPPKCALPQKCGKSLKVPTRVDKYMDFGGATRHYASVKGSNVAVTLGLVLLAVVPALLH